ncbi:hypothetical protein HPB48_004803 [Haemaphysalis longicornis]|uniref:Uncharacterized protein n=1 Tax=Haemaphysalis longicornis TaxID=44386 RepID=A0A9J6FCZ9_HAELO|nr:hypothetical protein HPB48_004803 [Haemaphysalis longicornis]
MASDAFLPSPCRYNAAIVSLPIEQDLKLIYSYMHVLEAVSSLKEANIRALCKTVRYERHDADDILYW